MSLVSAKEEYETDPTMKQWREGLLNSFKQNYNNDQSDIIYLPMCNIMRSGEISIHCLRFRNFLYVKDDVFLKFELPINDGTGLLGSIKSNKSSKLNWTMEKTSEYYKFDGKIYVVSTPSRAPIHALLPKIDDHDPSEYWEQQREQEWNKLDNKSRAIFTWPSRGQTPKAKDFVFSCQSLDVAETKLAVVRDIAKDNFGLLIYKITGVEHFDYSIFPPKRLYYTLPNKKNTWEVKTANP